MPQWNVRTQSWVPTPRQGPTHTYKPWATTEANNGGNARSKPKAPPAVKKPLETWQTEAIERFRATHPKEALWTPRKHMGPQSIWSLGGSQKALPPDARKERLRARPYQPPPPFAPRKKVVQEVSDSWEDECSPTPIDDRSPPTRLPHAPPSSALSPPPGGLH